MIQSPNRKYHKHQASPPNNGSKKETAETQMTKRSNYDFNKSLGITLLCNIISLRTRRKINNPTASRRSSWGQNLGWGGNRLKKRAKRIEKLENIKSGRFEFSRTATNLHSSNRLMGNTRNTH